MKNKNLRYVSRELIASYFIEPTYRLFGRVDRGVFFPFIAAYAFALKGKNWGLTTIPKVPLRSALSYEQVASSRARRIVPLASTKRPE